MSNVSGTSSMMLPGSRAQSHQVPPPIYGYDYARELEGRKAPLEPKQRRQLAIWALIGIVCCIAAFACSYVAVLDELTIGFARVGFVHIISLPFGYVYFRRVNGFAAASNVLLSAETPVADGPPSARSLRSAPSSDRPLHVHDVQDHPRALGDQAIGERGLVLDDELQVRVKR